MRRCSVGSFPSFPFGSAKRGGEGGGKGGKRGDRRGLESRRLFSYLCSSPCLHGCNLLSSYAECRDRGRGRGREKKFKAQNNACRDSFLTLITQCFLFCSVWAQQTRGGGKKEKKKRSGNGGEEGPASGADGVRGGQPSESTSVGKL